MKVGKVYTAFSIINNYMYVDTGNNKISTAYNDMRSDYTNMYLKQSK